MTGGIWSQTQMPVLPGLYLNFEAASLAAIQPGARGVVIAPVKAHWGPVQEFVEITSESAIQENYTLDITNDATAYTTLRLALLGGAKKVIAYRLASASAARASKNLQDTTASPVNVLKLEAKYPGARANNFRVTVQTNSVDSTKQDLKLYEGSHLLRTFTYASGTVDAAIAAVNDDPGNIYVTASKLATGNGTLALIMNQPLVGGDSGITGITNSDYINALTAFETRAFNILTLDGISAPDIQTSVAAWVTRLRSEGKGIIAILGGSSTDDTASDAVTKAVARSTGFNNEGIVNVGVGVKSSTSSYSSAQTAAYVAGLIAGQKLSEATTYASTSFEDVTRRWTRSEMEMAVDNGVFLLIHDGKMVKALRGINSLVSPAQGQNNAWKKIRTIRVMDAINSDLVMTAETTYIGKVNNTEEGRLTLIGACKQYLSGLAQSGVIDTTGSNVYLDPDYYGPGATLTPEADQVYLRWTAKLTDVMEQIFGTFIVQ